MSGDDHGHPVFDHGDGTVCIRDERGLWFTPYDVGGEGPECDRDHVLDAVGRVGEFSRQWEAQIRKPNGGKTDLVYSVHFDPGAEAVDLLNSDLLALVAEVRALRAQNEGLREDVAVLRFQRDCP